MHLLKEVLPAATSCASALDAAAIAPNTISALKVIFFIGCSLFLPGWSVSGCGMARSEWTSHETLTSFMGMRFLTNEQPIWPSVHASLVAYPNARRRA